MSGSDRPVRRRRIAGESASGGSAKPSVSRAPTVKKKGPKKVSAAKASGAAAAPKNVSARKASGPKARVSTAPAKTVSLNKAAAEKLTQPQASAATPASQPAESTPTSPRRREPWLIPATLLAVAALVLGSVLTFKGIDERSGGSDVMASQKQATKAASAAAETIFSFRYDKLPDHLTDSKAIMTPAFAKEFDKIAPALTDLAPQRKIVVQAVSRSSAAVDCGANCSTTKATILVFVDQARLVTGSDQPTVFGNRITMSMVKSDGTWLVNDIRAL